MNHHTAAMHVAIVCPFSRGPVRGNLTTVNRISRFLQQRGCRISLLWLDDPQLQNRLQLIIDDPPDLLHAFHALHAGPTAQQLAARLQRPYLITLTGSDLFDPALRDHPATRPALADAAAITCFDPMVAQLAVQSFPQVAHKLSVIPQGVEPFAQTTPDRRPDNALILLLPAALRPVKGIDFALQELAPLALELPQLQLWIAGGALDSSYADQIRSQAAALPWAQLLGEVPHQQMGTLYAASDLVLNCSQFEGGMANALLEAMVTAKPVLARDIPGNRSLIRHGETGWLFGDGEALRDLVRSIAEQPEQRMTVGRAAQNYVLHNFSPQQEANAFIQLYAAL